MKLSIIIPLYNTEKYIQKCIESIYINVKGEINLSDFEVIVINDGSSDNGRSIVEDLMFKYDNLLLINKENGGQSSARNVGFKIAKGNYIFCLDSDDYVDSLSLFNALRFCEEHDLDMMPIFHRIFDENYKELPVGKDVYQEFDSIITGGEFMNKFVVSGSMWRYFYKTSIIKDNDLYLTEGIYHEDEEFIMKFLSYSKRISYSKFLVYNHIIRSDSTVNQKNKDHRIKLLNDILVVIEHLDQHKLIFKEEKNIFNGLQKKIEQLSISLFLRMKQDQLSLEEVQEFIEKLNAINRFPLKADKLKIKFKIAAFIFNTVLFRKIIFK